MQNIVSQAAQPSHPHPNPETTSPPHAISTGSISAIHVSPIIPVHPSISIATPVVFSSTSSSHPTMLLRASSSAALSPLFASTENLSPSSPSLYVRKGRGSASMTVSMATASGGADSAPGLTGVLFEPFKELAKETSPDCSLARHMYADDCEAAINEQFNDMYAYFDRDDVALKGMAKFFKDSSEEEREHAEKFMEYQNKRGGRVKLQSLVEPVIEYDHPEKGDALYAMELALSLEKLNYEKLLNLHSVAEKNNDPQLADFVESEFLEEQFEDFGHRVNIYINPSVNQDK